MIFNYMGTILFIMAAWLAGQLFIHLTGISDTHYKNIHWISLPVGIALYAVLAAILYFVFGQTTAIIRLAYILVTIVSIIYFTLKKIEKNHLISLLSVIFLFTVMAFPGMITGTKLYVHRGNLWDKEFYLSEVVYMSQHDKNYGLEGILQESCPSDVLISGYTAVNSDRPVVPLLCASLMGKSWGDLFFQAYLFIIMVWVAVFCSMMLALELLMNGMHGFGQLSQKKSTCFQAFFAATYILGFYGQIQYDIDAWSQIVSAGSLLAFVCVYDIIFQKLLFENSPLTLGGYLMLTLTGTGVFLMYPENTMIYGMILIVISILVCLHNKFTVSLKEICKYLTIPATILALSYVAHSNTVKFALIQTFSAGSAKRQSWASYFDAYWLGWHGIPETESVLCTIRKLISLLPSWCGMFMILPDYECSFIIVFLWTVFTIIINLALIILFTLAAVRVWKMLSVKNKMIKGCFWLTAIVGICTFLVMVLKEKYWSAGKLLIYISPFLFMLLADSAMTALFCKKNIRHGAGKVLYTLLFTVSVLFIACQTLFACMRVIDIASNDSCTGYMGTYPSDQKPYLKETYPYHFNARNYTDTVPVAIQIEDRWYQDYVKLVLTHEGIPYYAVPDYNFGRGGEKEQQPILNPDDVIVTLENTY